ncbi:MAG: chemotaxis protein CheA, partial [Marinobacter sp.]
EENGESSLDQQTLDDLDQKSEVLIGQLSASAGLSDNTKAQSAAKVPEDKKTPGYDGALESCSNRLTPTGSGGDRSQGDQSVERMESGVSSEYWHISVRFGPDSYRDGLEPSSFLRYLGNLGRVVYITTVTDQLPDLESFNPEACYLGFEIQFDSQASKQQIEEAFEFMREDGLVRILPPHSQLKRYVELIELLPEVDLRLGEILVECGALTRGELHSALEQQRQFQGEAQSRAQPAKPLGEMLMAEDPRLAPVVEAALHKQEDVREKVAREQKTLRVDAHKLDELINLVGELVTAGASTVLQAERSADSQVIESVALLNNLLEDVRDATLKLRMVPIGATFAKFQRVVRDTAKDLGKDIDLVIKGADTELDKSVVEKIADPLMHLVRNALDHGIESPEDRRHAGKTATGTLTLNALHDSGSIVIEVTDNGKGLDVQKLRQKALEKGLIAEDDQLTRQQIFDLIFEPGFSTAAQVSNISGRGVGMDVVKRNITELRGRIVVESEPGTGTTIRIMLPLTLAIIDGFLVEVADDSYVIPLDLIQECVELNVNAENGHRKEPYINLKGQVLPLINLRDHFALEGRPHKRKSVVVVRVGGQRGGLVVDRLLGEFQTVIKPLGKVFEHVSGLSGSTILGSGKVALILDVQGLIKKLNLAQTRISRKDARE